MRTVFFALFAVFIIVTIIISAEATSYPQFSRHPHRARQQHRLAGLLFGRETGDIGRIKQHEEQNVEKILRSLYANEQPGKTDNEVDFDEYQDVSEDKPKQKRYLGIDIPDYISSTGGRSDALMRMSDKMKAMGKKKRSFL